MWSNMGKLRGDNFKYIIYFFTGLIWGILIGSIIITSLISYRMDQHYKEITYLENIILDREAKLEKLEDTINTQYVVLKDIEVHLDFQGDELDKIEIEKSIREKYTTLLGKEVKTIDADILIEVIDKRIFKIDKKEYRLRVDKLILTEILKIHIEVQSDL